MWFQEIFLGLTILYTLLPFGCKVATISSNFLNFQLLQLPKLNLYFSFIFCLRGLAITLLQQDIANIQTFYSTAKLYDETQQASFFSVKNEE